MIEILIGVSGSGKTTLANKILSESPNMVRVNRDDLRKTLFGVEQTDTEYYNRNDLRDCEKLVSEISEQIIYDSLHKGKDIVVDNTNLQYKYIEEIIRKFNHLSDISLNFIHDVSTETYKEIQERLLKRFSGDSDKISYVERQMGDYKKLLIQMHSHQLFYPQNVPTIKFDETLPRTWAFDIDGTLAKKGDRDIFDDSKLHLDKEIVEVGEILRALVYKGLKIIFISGRQDSCYEQTKQWLVENGLWQEDSEMFMRKAKDTRPDYIIKEEIIVNDVAPKYNLVGVFDDRLQVSREYYRLGIFTANVNQNLIQF